VIAADNNCKLVPGRLVHELGMTDAVEATGIAAAAPAFTELWLFYS